MLATGKLDGNSTMRQTDIASVIAQAGAAMACGDGVRRWCVGTGACGKCLLPSDKKMHAPSWMVACQGEDRKTLSGEDGIARWECPSCGA
jgi:hypothetical protein